VERNEQNQIGAQKKVAVNHQGVVAHGEGGVATDTEERGEGGVFSIGIII
jgi:hypothetical protein